jgi:hypothetical protein
MRSIEVIDGSRTETEPTKATVWICPECFDAYEDRPRDGECQNPGHAAVELVATPLRPVRDAVLAPVGGRTATKRKRSQGGRRRPRATQRRKTEAA